MRELTQISAIFATERVEAFQRRYRAVNAVAALAGSVAFLLYHGEVIPSEHKTWVYLVQAVCLFALLGEPLGVYLTGRNLRYAFRHTAVDSVAAALGLGMLASVGLLSPGVLNVLNEAQSTGALVLLVQGGVVFYSLERLLRFFNVLAKLTASPLTVFIASFNGLILVGAGLLMLPGATVAEGSPRFVDALFMATSAACVTGLATMDIGTQFKPFGQLVILVLIQFGGLGIMTFAAFFSLMFGSGAGVRDSAALGEMMNVNLAGRVGRVAAWVLGITLSCELLGVALLYGCWKGPEGPLPADQQLYYSVFHSVSAFCNAGFGLHSDSLMGYADHWPVVLNIGWLVVVGGLGFPVIVELLTFRFWALPAVRRLPILRRYVPKQPVPRLSVQTKLVVTGTLLLLGLAMGVFWLMERGHSLAGLDAGGQLAGSLFHSLTPRTAGFNTLDLEKMQPATHFFTMLLMLVGGSPGGTAGGLKTTTVVILLLAVVALIRGRSPEILRRRIPDQLVVKSLVMLVLAFSFISAAVFALLATEQDTVLASSSHGGLRLMFEAVSAFATTGLSVGVTPRLTEAGKLIIITCMFLGRIGPLTLVLAISARRAQRFEYPKEGVMIG
mgnify:FL=1